MYAKVLSRQLLWSGNHGKLSKPLLTGMRSTQTNSFVRNTFSTNQGEDLSKPPSPTTPSTMSSTDFTSDKWAWIPPRARAHLQEQELKRRYQLPIVLEQCLTHEEIKSYIEDNGGEDVWIGKFDNPLEDITSVVIASFPSKWMIRPVAEGLLKNIKMRGFRSTGIDGERNDAWQCIDCKNTIVHLFRRDVRGYVNLEEQFLHHDDLVELTGNEKEDERRLEEQSDKYAEHPGYLDYLEETDDDDGPDNLFAERK